MAITTSPDNIPSPTSGDPYSYVADMAALADGTQDALTQKANMGVGTSTQRTAALSKFPDGALWYDTTTSSEWRKVGGAWAVDSSGTQLQSSDATYPKAASGITAETVVDRITIAAAPYARRVSVSTVVFALASVTHDRAELLTYSGATAIGATRHQFYLASAVFGIAGLGYVELAAGAGSVIEVRIARNSGSGTITTSASANLTKTVATIAPAA